ncbi:histidine phosphotransferase ChpT [soil metagenome]
MTDDPARLASVPTDMTGTEMATYVAAKLCHDFVSPAGAIMSGLDLLNDPEAQDMRDDALGLITQSATKLIALIHFCRVAFGAATTSERFTGEDLKGLVDGMIHGGRATMTWSVSETDLAKPAARALVNLAYLTVGALPTGGVATITSHREGDSLVLTGLAEGARARLKAEAVTGLSGQRLSEGLAGQWVQPYWLWLTASEAGGSLTTVVEEGRVALIARMPL